MGSKTLVIKSWLVDNAVRQQAQSIERTFKVKLNGGLPKDLISSKHDTW